MKKYLYSFFLVFILLFLCSCDCNHEFSEATCENPKICIKCKKIEKEALGHNYIDGVCVRCWKTTDEICNHEFSEATCTESKVCIKCGRKDGEALGHDYSEATYLSAKICKRCGETLGEKIGEHICEFRDATCTTPKICKICQKEVGEALGHTEEYHFDEDVCCLEEGYAKVYCKVCKELLCEGEMVKEHEIVEEVTEVTCTTNGKTIKKCLNCNYVKREYVFATGHEYTYIIDHPATKSTNGYRHKECLKCKEKGVITEYSGNGFSLHGKLSVEGSDLVDQDNEKFQLIGLSTHGLQWFGKFVNYDTFASLRDGFGINVIRLSLYTAEGGYCEVSKSERERLFNLVCSGIDYATELDMYVIIDWHMLGAEDARDKNPLFYKDEAVDFFSRISLKYKDYDNILYEIMNEPSGATSWNDCKEYATLVIPEIRKNSDGIILVGSPKWSADIDSIMKSPLIGYSNIMYSYHFYAGDKTNASKIKVAYQNNIPIFVTEHGGMENTGDGEIYYDYINQWYLDLDELNISYVAWNIANSKGSASIFKEKSSNLVSVNDENLKEWGIYYRNHTREKFNLSKYINR